MTSQSHDDPDTIPTAVLEGIARHGNGFRAAREAAGITVDELAERADLDRPRVEDLEAGSTAPTRPEAEKLAVALGVPSRLFLE